jgi:hypothetical protein
MFRKIVISLIVLTLGLVAFAPMALAGGRGSGPVIYVTSQDLYYDSIVTADPLPWKGPFQELKGPAGAHYTMYGPGDQEYVGGRWWVDTNGNGYEDADDHFFSCPLLGPGRETP